MMEQTITQNGALFVAQQGQSKPQRRVNGYAPKHKVAPILTFRTTVGEFALRSSQIGYRLEIKAGKLCRLLGFHQTAEAAVIALTNRRSGFQPWDLMGRHSADIQIDTRQRWTRTL
jgi:hypothetical protein